MLATFERRDRTLATHRDGDYVLWFEADLYDHQVQIIQILSQLGSLHVLPRGCADDGVGHEIRAGVVVESFVL